MHSNSERAGNILGLLMPGLVLASVQLAGCGESSEQKPEKKPVDRTDTKELQTPLESANDYLAVSDLDKFLAGRSRSEILKELHWRAGSVEMAECKGVLARSSTGKFSSDFV